MFIAISVTWTKFERVASSLRPFIRWLRRSGWNGFESSWTLLPLRRNTRKYISCSDELLLITIVSYGVVQFRFQTLKCMLLSYNGCFGVRKFGDKISKSLRNLGGTDLYVHVALHGRTGFVRGVANVLHEGRGRVSINKSTANGIIC